MSKNNLQIIKFLAVGGLVAVFNLLFLYLFTEFFHFWYLISSIISYFMAVVLNFTLQKFWVFENKNEGVLSNQMFWYGLISIGYLLANTCLMYLFVDILHIQYLVSQTVITLILSLLNYFINRNFIFRQR